MIKPLVSLEETIEFLNTLVKLDRQGMEHLIQARVPVTQTLALHPTVQVLLQGSGYSLGFLGILNGLFGVTDRGWGAIVAVFENGSLVKFDRSTAYGGEDRSIDLDLEVV